MKNFVSKFYTWDPVYVRLNSYHCRCSDFVNLAGIIKPCGPVTVDQTFEVGKMLVLFWRGVGAWMIVCGVYQAGSEFPTILPESFLIFPAIQCLEYTWHYRTMAPAHIPPYILFTCDSDVGGADRIIKSCSPFSGYRRSLISEDGTWLKSVQLVAEPLYTMTVRDGLC
jgi:hypothetical protein